MYLEGEPDSDNRFMNYNARAIIPPFIQENAYAFQAVQTAGDVFATNALPHILDQIYLPIWLPEGELTAVKIQSN